MELKATTYAVDDGVAVITLSRPHRNNAWTGRMHTEYRWLIQTAEDDQAVGAIVVTGAGSVFCVGGDSLALDGHAERGSYDAGTPADLANPGYGVSDDFDADFAFQMGLNTPIIAAMNGSAAGVGLAAVLFADIRFGAETAKISTAHGKLGLAAEYGMSWMLPRLIGLTRAADLLLSSRKAVVAELADWGIFNQVLPAAEVLPAAMAYAQMLVAEVSPASVASTKRQIWLDQHRGAGTAVRDSNRRLNEMMASGEYREGVRALTERRDPDFRSAALEERNASE
jgi:enoyl-CoA hydratase/carnithine racemase